MTSAAPSRRFAAGGSLRKAAERSGRLLPPDASTSRATGGRAHRRHHARIRLHSAAALAASAGEWRLESAHAAADRQGGASILARQLPDGGFNIYPQGPSDISATVKAYFALKLAGLPYDDPRSDARARTNSGAGRHSGGQQLRQGQPEPVRSLSARALPVDSARDHAARQVHLRDVFLDARDRDSALDRARDESAASGPGGIQSEGTVRSPACHPEFPRNRRRAFTWRNVFLRLDKVAEVLGDVTVRKAMRQHAIRKAEQWMLERTRYTDGLAAIYPPMMYVIMALDLLGYPPGSSGSRGSAEAVRQSDGGRRARASSSSPASRWCGTPASRLTRWANPAEPPDDALRSCADWLLTKEVRRKGDWSVKRPNIEPSGWYFEFANEFYPDIDDTAQVLLALEPLARVAIRPSRRPASGAPSTGCSPCSRRTAAGRRSMSTTTGGL